jgi:hypothetical protein
MYLPNVEVVRGEGAGDEEDISVRDREGKG